MAFDGSGNFSFPYSWALDAANGIAITASRMDTQFLNCTQGFDLCITRDAQGVATAIIPFPVGITSDTVNEYTATHGTAIRGTSASPIGNASAGYVGELVEVSPTTTSLTTATAANVGSISLTPGDWEVSANCGFVGASGTTVVFAQVSLSLTTGTPNATIGFIAQSYLNAAPFTTVSTINYDVGPVRFNLATTTTIFCVAQSGFSGAALSAQGFMHARRVR